MDMTRVGKTVNGGIVSGKTLHIAAIPSVEKPWSGDMAMKLRFMNPVAEEDERLDAETKALGVPLLTVLRCFGDNGPLMERTFTVPTPHVPRSGKDVVLRCRAAAVRRASVTPLKPPTGRQYWFGSGDSGRC